MAAKQIYLAGPDVFWPEAAAIGAAKKALCLEYGFCGHFPLDTELDLTGLSPYQAGLSIFNANTSLMNDCDLIIANMTPFRGPSMDVGTAFEMGYVAAMKKPVWGYTLDNRNYAERVNGELTDAEGYSIEAFDMPDNLMMIGATDTTGGLITAKLEQTIENHLKVFETVLQQILTVQK
ncbi:nucleoside 2-deoxyribosyltransferase [Amphritea sp. HPY]|uniref:nucleoside 2-deoxyribosyltransferase n=1 Tax=Amphritea sp. HPY TaxID=3421652 RepID=UPI003D7DF03E